MTALLEEVLFNHDPADKRGSALNLRVNADRPLMLPEWQRQADGSPWQAPAAYAARVIVPSLLRVGASVRWIGAPRASIEVRALNVMQAGDLRAPLLGEVVARMVPLGADGLSGRKFFALRGGWLAAAPVGVHEVRWRWQWRGHAGEPWVNFAGTRHEVYTTLLPPSAP